MSRSSTRWSALSALAACVQFLPCPKRPWQKTTRDPDSPSSVRCRLTGPSSRTRCDDPTSGGGDPAVVGGVDQPVAGGEGERAVEAVLLPPAPADDLTQVVGRGRALRLEGADDLAHL